MSQYEVFEDAKGKYRWRLVATNGEIVAQSEAYDSQFNARRGVADAKQASEEAQRDVAYKEQVP